MHDDEVAKGGGLADCPWFVVPFPVVRVQREDRHHV